MNPIIFTLICAEVINAFLCISLLRHKPFAWHRFFFALTVLQIFLWTLVYIVAVVADSPVITPFLVRSSLYCVLFLPYTLLLFSMHLTQDIVSRALQYLGLVLPLVILVILQFEGANITGFTGPVEYENANVGIAYNVYSVYFLSFFLVSLLFLFRAARGNTVDRGSIVGVMAVYGATGAFAITTASVLPSFFDVYTTAAAARLAGVLLSAAIAYTITRHRFMGFALVLHRWHILFLSIVALICIGFAYAIAVFGIEAYVLVLVVLIGSFVIYSRMPKEGIILYHRGRTDFREVFGRAISLWLSEVSRSGREMQDVGRSGIDLGIFVYLVHERRWMQFGGLGLGRFLYNNHPLIDAVDWETGAVGLDIAEWLAGEGCGYVIPYAFGPNKRVIVLARIEPNDVDSLHLQVDSRRRQLDQALGYLFSVEDAYEVMRRL